ncbi:hypothetical protein PCH_Pc16g00250 [Penicillium rubens Wisconsin 54-1255]|uniref:Uncharacterized protein n=1 Tax=Penicillium rubens (strain ATCC 28089 / DSM 1075 / NRRL 1951 / Wisconsin 54-1255) TaxID=500485 RepID=B6H6T3_PENRW|nr:hypothetical protein PCH_Pc16g00250 [Penicillium rubens Wisconsin 54-1255]
MATPVDRTPNGQPRFCWCPAECLAFVVATLTGRALQGPRKHRWLESWDAPGTRKDSQVPVSHCVFEQSYTWKTCVAKERPSIPPPGTIHHTLRVIRANLDFTWFCRAVLANIPSQRMFQGPYTRYGDLHNMKGMKWR